MPLEEPSHIQQPEARQGEPLAGDDAAADAVELLRQEV